MPQAKGKFDVTRTGEPPYELPDGFAIGRNRFDKKFHGPLEATSSMLMIAVGTETKGSAAYVAIEHITGTLEGRAGTFVVTHKATMNRGAPSMSITVVPDSGTGALTGLSGSIHIDIVDGAHFYTFDYELQA